MASLISLIVTLVLLGLVWYLLFWIVGQMPLPEPFKTVATVILGLVAVLVLLSLIFGIAPLPVLRVRSL